MLEDSAMDKKPNSRSGSGPGKANASETKSKQDVVTNKFTRSGRRRESPCPRPEVPKKTVPQKNKGVDKRPRPRGYNYDRDRSEVAVASVAEVGSALQQGSKKLNLNHLLNFTYAPRNTHGPHWNNTWRNRNKWSTKKHKYNKEQFLQASCQFVVRAEGEYGVHAVDPDLLVDWDSIELIRLLGHEVPSCPICLYQPLAAKITRCGHIYCWSCILHYLSLSDKPWRKCPICFEAVHKKDLKSVVALSTHQYNTGEFITMRLMRREKGSVFAMTINNWKDRKGTFLHVDDASEDVCFSKLLTATPSQVQSLILSRERQELNKAMSEDKDCPETCFIESALEFLKERECELFKNQEIDSTTKHMSEIQLSSSPEEPYCNNLSSCRKYQNKEKNQITYTNAFIEEVEEVSRMTSSSSLEIDENSGENSELPVLPTTINTASFTGTRQRCESSGTDSIEGGVDVTAEDLDISDVHVDCSNAEKNVTKDNYYFYQAEDGQNIYLHALNVRMLVKQYGGLDKCPETITAKIIEKEGISMNEELRKRLRYLRHLPLTCEFEVVELLLKPPIISEEIGALFADEIEKRKHRRNKKAREERRRERHIQEEENRRWGKFPTARLNLESRCQFPECTSTADTGVVHEEPVHVDVNEIPKETTHSRPNSAAGSWNSASSDFGTLASNGIAETPHCSSVPSFAQMLRNGKAKPNTVKESKNKLDEAGAASITTLDKKKHTQDSESEPEDYVPVPEYHKSFGDAIQAALQKATSQTPDADTENMAKKKKKKGRQKQLLFTTSMARSK